MHTELVATAGFRGPVATAMPPQELIRHAHARSAAYGLRAQDVVEAAPLAGADLRTALQRNQTLAAHALPVMETLFAQIAGTRSMVLLTDPQGVILHAVGDDDFVARADRVALRPGGVWSEERKGTNAIGTALTSGQAVQVHAGQHYLRAHQFLTCACVPILDPQGVALGALDVSGDHRGQSPHTMALVRMSAQMVENHLWSKVHEDAVCLRFHARPRIPRHPDGGAGRIHAGRPLPFSQPQRAVPAGDVPAGVAGLHFCVAVRHGNGQCAGPLPQGCARLAVAAAAQRGERDG